MRPFLLAVLWLALAFPSSAQLILGCDETAPGATNAWYVDVETGNVTPLWSGIMCWGLATDDANRTIYFNSDSALYAAQYPGCTPVLLGTVKDLAGAPQSLVGLAFVEGVLYATKSVGNEAVYAIDPATLIATVVLDYPDDEYDLGGLDYNPQDELFYATNDDPTPHGAGIFALNVLRSQEIAFVASYPAGVIDVDGCAVGNGKVWLVEDEPAPLHCFDLATRTYDPQPLPSPIGAPEVFSGGAFAPGLVVPGNVVAYCTAKPSSCGTLPAIGSSGTPSATAASGFEITCINARGSDPFNLKNGVLIYSVTGPGNAPFQGGTLCLMAGAPIKRTITLPPAVAGTPGNCDAVHVIDMNAFAQKQIPGQANPDLALTQVCQQVWCQWFARDSVASGPLLSDALTYVLGP
jgi:hypothetical protein